MIRVSDLSASIGEKAILREVSFGLTRGESVGIVGPNGAGKSTLLRHLAGLVAPESGEVLYEGRSVHQIPQRERAQRMAMLMQGPDTGFHLTAQEIVQMARYPFLRRFQPEGARDRELVRAALEKTCTLHLQDRTLEEMSGGERQRVFLARALAQEPEVLWLDEPTTYLDVFHQHELLGLLQAAKQQQGLTWIAVLHDLNLAAQYCEKILLLAEGRLVALGTPQEVLVPEIIGEVYNVEVLVVQHEQLSFPQLVFTPKRFL